MANINVGFTESRNSSRVLKPPGGESSDIFGTAHLQQPRHPHPRQQCAIKDILEQTKEKPEPTMDQKNKEIVEKQLDMLKISEEDDNNSNEIKEEIKENEETNGNGENVEIVEEKIEEKTEQIEIKSEKNVVEEKIVEINSDTADTKPTRFKNRVPPGGYSSGLW